MGTIKATNIEPIADNGTVTLGSSGDTFTVPSGVTVNMSNATQTGVGGKMTPAFHAYLSANQSITNATFTKLNANTETFDTDNCYDNSTNYRFTPTSAGKYYVYSGVELALDDYAIYSAGLSIYKNGSAYSFNQIVINTSVLFAHTPFISNVIDMNGSTDYIEIFGYLERHSSTGNRFNTNTKGSYFGAYKIIE